MDAADEARAGALLPYLHLARRSGAMALGHSAVKQSLAAGRCSLVVMARDAGASLRRLDTGDTPRLELADRRTLGDWVGRSELAVFGLTSRELAAGVLKRLAELEREPAPRSGDNGG